MGAFDFFSISSILTWAFTAVVVLLLVQFLLIATRRTHYAKLIDAIPGPYAPPLLGNAWHFFGPHKQNLMTAIKLMSNFPKQPVVRFWLGTIAIVWIKEAKTAEAILSSTQHITKSTDYALLKSWIGEGLLSSTGSKWFAQRKMLTPAFHFRILDDFFAIFNEQAKVLVQKFDQLASKGSFDVTDHVALCALDIVCESTMGQSVNAQKDNDSEYVKAVHGFGEIFMMRVFLPWLQNDFIYKLSSWYKKEKIYLKIMHTFSKRVISERRNYLKKNNVKWESDETDIPGQKKRRAFLDLLLLSTCNGEFLTDEEVQEQVDTFMFAGHDTTGSSLSSIIYMLGAHPNVQKRLKEEVEQVIGLDDKIVTKEDLDQLKYMDAVIKESLRLFPPVAVFARNLKQDAKIGEYHVPADTTIFITPYFIHRDPEMFPNPEVFDPSRFFKDTPAAKNPFAFIPFSAGPRNCIGQKFAMMAQKVILCKLVQNFNIISRDHPADIKLYIDPILRSVNGIFVNLEKRP